MPACETYGRLREAFDEGRSNRDVLRILKPRLAAVANGETGNDIGSLIQHPLGFFTYNPQSEHEVTDPNLAYAFHIWPVFMRFVAADAAGEPYTTSAVHGHSFDFDSRLMHGELEDQPMHVAISPATEAKRIYNERGVVFGVFNAISRPDGYDVLDRLPLAATVTPGQSRIFEEGQTYHMSSDAFHASEAFNDDCVTLMLAQNNPSLPNLTLGLHELCCANVFDRTQIHGNPRVILGREATVTAAGQLLTFLEA